MQLTLKEMITLMSIIPHRSWQQTRIYQMMEHPELIDFLDFATGKLDLFKYSYPLLEYDDRKRELPDIVETSSKRKFMHRNVYDG
jgi:hypothetical protein